MADKSRGILLVLGRALGVALGLFGLITTVTGCGGNGNDLAEFAGTWEYTTSQGTLACTGAPASSGLLGTTKHWAMGVSSDLVDLTPEIFDLGTQCLYAFDVKDKIATIQASQTCNFSDGAGGLVEEDPTTWTFTLTSATTAVENYTTTIATTCTMTGSGSLKKVATSN